MNGSPLLGPCSTVANVIIDAGNVGPIPFYRDDVEAIWFDQQTGDPRPGSIEFVGAMCRLTQQQHAGIGEAGKGNGEVGCLRWRQCFSAGPQYGGQVCRAAKPSQPWLVMNQICPAALAAINCRGEPTRQKVCRVQGFAIWNNRRLLGWLHRPLYQPDSES